MKRKGELQERTNQLLPVIPDINDEIFLRAGITAEDRARLLKKAFVSTERRLVATEKKVFHDKGVLVYSEPMADHSARAKAVDQALQLVGIKKQDAPKIVIKANVVLPSWSQGEPVTLDIPAKDIKE